MLHECDTVAICTALGPETTGLITAHRLALMKPSAFPINIARGQVIDEDALYATLHGNKIGGAAIDVWWQYPNQNDPARRGSRHPFHELPNTIVTPHNSGWTAGMVRRAGMRSPISAAASPRRQPGQHRQLPDFNR